MKIQTNTLLTASIAACALLAATSADAAVIVNDNGTTAPTLGANDTGLITPVGPGDNRFGWDTETVNQTFTTTSAGTIGSIFLGYNGFADTDTITFNLSVNGSPVQTGITLDGVNFSGNEATDGNSGPYYWMEFDLSSANVPVIAGSNSFTFDATANTGNSWALAPRINTNNPYSGGELFLNGNATGDDLYFAVTVIPEPASLALMSLGGLLIASRRRRA